MQTNIPHLALIKKEIETDVQEFSAIVTEVKKIIIETKEQFVFATRFTSELKKRYNEIEDKRRAFTKPLNTVKKDIDNFFKDALTPLKQAEQILKEKLIKYNSLQQKEEPLKTKEYTEKEIWDGEVEDVLKIISYALENKMAELFIINTNALLQITRIKGEDPNIPGWKCFKRKVACIKS